MNDINGKNDLAEQYPDDTLTAFHARRLPSRPCRNTVVIREK